jgi:dipeptidyl aminopeptidase/acylaminoacyl peptidase
MNSLVSPNEAFLVTTSGKSSPSVKQISNLSTDLIGHLGLDKSEEFWFSGADPNFQVHGFLLRPPGFEKDKKYPLAFLVHGGPQGAWTDSWSTRWNPNVFTAKGYVVVAINPTGSTGYGQDFTDAINQNWGGKPFKDLVAGLVRNA